MEREKAKFDILGKIERERLARGWTEYTLAENSGLTQSTISTWRRRNLQPSVASIEKICLGLGLTLSEFFREESTEQKTLQAAPLLPMAGAAATLPLSAAGEQRHLLEAWNKLAPQQRTAVLHMLESFVEK